MRPFQHVGRKNPLRAYEALVVLTFQRIQCFFCSQRHIQPIAVFQFGTKVRVHVFSALLSVCVVNLVPIYWNHIMFAHDLCHSQIEYFSLRLGDPTARRGMLSHLNRKDRAKRYHKSSIFNRQYSIPACPGWGLIPRSLLRELSDGIVAGWVYISIKATIFLFYYII